MNTRISRGVAVAIASFGLVCGASAAPTLVSVPTATLDQYVGAYKYSDHTVVRVTREGDHLKAHFTGEAQGTGIYPQSTNEFFYLGIGLDASLEFEAQRAVLKQNGERTSMARIDEQTAAQIEQAVADRVASQAANPRSEAALQSLIEDIRNGRIDEELLAPQLVGALNKDLAKLQVRLAELGPAVDVTFSGVNAAGGDEYQVSHIHGVSDWSVVVDDRGVITGATIP